MNIFEEFKLYILVNGRLYLELSRELFEEAFINIRDNKINSIIK